MIALDSTALCLWLCCVLGPSSLYAKALLTVPGFPGALLTGRAAEADLFASCTHRHLMLLAGLNLDPSATGEGQCPECCYSLFTAEQVQAMMLKHINEVPCSGLDADLARTPLFCTRRLSHCCCSTFGFYWLQPCLDMLCPFCWAMHAHRLRYNVPECCCCDKVPSSIR